MRPIDQLAVIIDRPVVPHPISATGIDVIAWHEDHLIEIEEYEIATSGERIAWLERHYQPSSPNIEMGYKIKGMFGHDKVFDWDVVTYNPAFGCQVFLLRWWGDLLVFVYHEKHDINASNFDTNGLVKLINLSHEIAILEGKILYRNWGEPEQVHILSLPDLSLQKTIKYKTAVAQGVELNKLCVQNWYQDSEN